MVGGRVGLVGDDGFSLALHHRPRFANPVSLFGQFFRQSVQNLGFALAVQQFNGGLVGDHEMVFAERPRVAMDIAFADILNPLGVVRSESWIDERDFAVMFAFAVAGRPGNDELRAVREPTSGPGSCRG